MASATRICLPYKTSTNVIFPLYCFKFTNIKFSYYLGETLNFANTDFSELTNIDQANVKIEEIDKMTKDIKGDPASALLEVLDKEQNSHFVDHYIEEEFDLGNVMFIATANYIEQIPNELRDRLEIVELSSYTEYEKLDIARIHLIPTLLEEHGVEDSRVSFSDEAILSIIRSYTKESGVRELDRLLATIIRKIVKDIVLDKSKDNYKITIICIRLNISCTKMFGAIQ